MMAGSLYLRTTIPVRYKVGGWGVGPRIVTEVSPEAIDRDKNMPVLPPNKKQQPPKNTANPGSGPQVNTYKSLIGHPHDTIYWGFGPNEPVGKGRLDFLDGAVVEWWGEGLAAPRRHEIYFRFVQIKSVDDFKKAFDLVFSRKPLQDEHPEWPEEIRNAIAARKIVKGMSRLQAAAVVGVPIAVEKSGEGGKAVEIWTPRQDLGTALQGGKNRVWIETSGFPASIRFVDGQVASFD